LWCWGHEGGSGKGLLPDGRGNRKSSRRRSPSFGLAGEAQDFHSRCQVYGDAEIHMQIPSEVSAYSIQCSTSLRKKAIIPPRILLLELPQDVSWSACHNAVFGDSGRRPISKHTATKSPVTGRPNGNIPGLASSSSERDLLAAGVFPGTRTARSPTEEGNSTGSKRTGTITR